MSPTSKHYKVGRIGIGNAAKVGGTLGCVVGFLAGLITITVLLSQHGMPQGSEADLNMGLITVMPFLMLGVVGIDCMLLAALLAWVFNLTTRFSGGLILQLEEVAGPAATE